MRVRVLAGRGERGMLLVTAVDMLAAMLFLKGTAMVHGRGGTESCSARRAVGREVLPAGVLRREAVQRRRAGGRGVLPAGVLRREAQGCLARVPHGGTVQAVAPELSGWLL